MQHTQNYNFDLPEANDDLETASRTAFDDNFTALDTLLKDVEDDIDDVQDDISGLNAKTGEDIPFESGSADSISDKITILDNSVGDKPSGETNTLWDKVSTLLDNFKVVHLTESGFTFIGDKYFQKAYTVPTGYTIVDMQVHLTNATALTSAMYRDGTINVFAGRWSSNTFIPGGNTWAFNLYILLAKNDIIE